MAKLFTEIEIVADERLNEQLIAVLSQLGFEGFWEEVREDSFGGTALRCYINRERWSEALLAEVRNVVNAIHRASVSPAPHISVRDVDDKNWNEEWEKTIQPIHVTDKIVITPTWHAYNAQPEELVLIIDPKMSFGTGYHETTRLVLRLMEKYVRKGMILLDVGTGTGVLAIAGIKLGASTAVGVDNDEWSYENAIENVQLNHVSDRVKIILGELASVSSLRFDMIVANIQKNVIEPLLQQMHAMVNGGGIVILSGLLEGDEQPLQTGIDAAGFAVAEMTKENEWIAFAIKAR